ncbi:hypothetical protein GEMRC1_002397 [Eukaryota sp. GEM-RC1]
MKEREERSRAIWEKKKKELEQRHEQVLLNTISVFNDFGSGHSASIPCTNLQAFIGPTGYFKYSNNVKYRSKSPVTSQVPLVSFSLPPIPSPRMGSSPYIAKRSKLLDTLSKKQIQLEDPSVFDQRSFVKSLKNM